MCPHPSGFWPPLLLNPGGGPGKVSLINVLMLLKVKSKTSENHTIDAGKQKQ